MLLAKYRRPEAKFGHDTGQRFAIVRGPNLKTDLESQDLYLVPQKMSKRSDE